MLNIFLTVDAEIWPFSRGLPVKSLGRTNPIFPMKLPPIIMASPCGVLLSADTGFPVRAHNADHR